MIRTVKNEILTKSTFEKICYFLYDLLKPEEKSEIQPTESMCILKDIINKKLRISKEDIEKCFDILLKNDLLIVDY